MFLVVLIQRQDLEKEKIAAAQLRVQSGQFQAIGVTVSRRMVREIERASSWNVPRACCNGTGGSSDSPAST